MCVSWRRLSTESAGNGEKQWRLTGLTVTLLIKLCASKYVCQLFTEVIAYVSGYVYSRERCGSVGMQID